MLRLRSRFGLACSLGVALALVPGALQARPIPFQAPSTVAPGVDGADAVVAADLDHDGDLDLISASELDDKVAWYENDGTPAAAWTTHVISTTEDGAAAVCAADIDRDGDLDVLCASSIANHVVWFVNDGTPVDGGWTTKTFMSAVSGARSVCAADMDRDGDLDVLAAAFNGDQFVLFQNDGTSNLASWTTRVIRSGIDGAISIVTADLDRDGLPDVVGAAYNADDVLWFRNNGTIANIGTWTAATLDGTLDGAQSVCVSDVDRDGDLDVLAAASNAGVVKWYANDGSPNDGGWVTRTIAPAGGAAAVFAADLDEDGDVDILSAAQIDDRITWYENDGASPPAWGSHDIAAGVDGASSVVAADLDGDGDVDVASSASAADRVDWYRNVTIHRSAAYSPLHSIDTFLAAVPSASPGDVDGDGDLDVVSVDVGLQQVTWQENVNGDGSVWTTRVISTAESSPRAEQVVDLDRDGDLDVVSVSTSDHKILWHENLGAAPPAWSDHPIGPSSVVSPMAVSVADIDRDGDLDVVTGDGSGSKLVWFDNVGPPTGWIQRTIVGPGGSGVASIRVADVDRDGDANDVIVAWTNSDQIVWYQSGAAGPTMTWTPMPITAVADGVQSIDVADIDGDGDLDVLGAQFNANSVVWYEQQSPSLWTARTITSSATGAAWVMGSDLDGDGDTDALMAAYDAADVTWFENDAGSMPAWIEHVISGTSAGSSSATAADLDRDGDLDVLASTLLSSEPLVWYENRGGQFALTTASTAPPTIPEGQADDVLKITASHRGRAGDSDLELATLDLLFEKPGGVPLTTAEANAVIANLRVYRDNGSGAFEAGADALVTNVATLVLFAGRQSVAFVDGDPNVQVPFGTPRQYFVVPELTANAAAQTPNAFRVTHVTGSTSTAEDRVYDLLLSLEFVANESSSIVTAQGVTAVDTLAGLEPGCRLSSPTPSRGRVEFSFTLREPGDVRLAVFDVAGREVARLADGRFPPGAHRASWDPYAGLRGASGLYFARYRAPGSTVTRRVVVLP